MTASVWRWGLLDNQPARPGLYTGTKASIPELLRMLDIGGRATWRQPARGARAWGYSEGGATVS